MTGRETSVTSQLAALFPEGWDHITATVVRLTGDWGLAEECTQDAFTQALSRWPTDGIPDKPVAWLVTTARNRALDLARRVQLEAMKLRLVAGETLRDQPGPRAAIIGDDNLELMFACAHPALATDAQVALILSALTPLDTTEIADAFLVSERAMRQRLFRAKQRLRQARGTLQELTPPPRAALPGRLPAILQVLYVLFNAGYEGLGDTGPVRVHLLNDVLFMGRMVASLLPGEAEAGGLLALMLLHHARRDAHNGEGGFIPLADQDRSRWDHAEISEGLSLVDQGRFSARRGPFQLRAAIAACHAQAATAAQTDWRRIARLYAEFAEVSTKPTLATSQALPIAMADSPEAGILLVNGRPARYLLPPAARASVLRRAQRLAEAVDAFEESLNLAAPIALARAELAGGWRPD